MNVFLRPKIVLNFIFVAIKTRLKIAAMKLLFGGISCLLLFPSWVPVRMGPSLKNTSSHRCERI